MKRILTLLVLLTGFNLGAQDDYFQQEVNYDIKASLDDENHVLTGAVFLEYVNNSPDTLQELLFHLWPNAYKNDETAFAKQQLRNNSTRFHFSDLEKRGGYTQISFELDGEALPFSKYENTEDIAEITLNAPLLPGQSIRLNIPFELDIPSSFSRLGHVEQSYQMTQWYPKPAVYDQDGWHPLSYLDMGEFYSEFGRFEVELTLPDNYVVGATGELQTESEKAFLQQKIKETKAWAADYETEKSKTRSQLHLNQHKADSIPPSSRTLKTIRWSAQNVHDFAWFADKRFRVMADEVVLNSGKKIKTYTMFSKLEEEIWKDAITYVNRSVKFYSDHVGDYPYPHATAVQSALSAGGGMEYPMITVIGQAGTARSLDQVITHEVGHNWFYGILGTNERIHPWMDEGMNSYFENRYMRENYGEGTLSLTNFGVPEFIVGGSPYDGEQTAHLLQVCNHRAQRPDMDSEDMTRINYGIGAYFKPALALRQMELALGTARFDAAMKAYYDTWKFKHPNPEDFRKIIDEVADTDISWFLDGFMYNTDEQDYKIKNVTENANSYTIRVVNKGEVAAPFPINGISEDTLIVATKWYKGFMGEKELELAKGDYDVIMLDGQFVTLEMDHRNNFNKINGSKLRPLSLRLVGGIENPKKVYTAIAPLLAYNAYDGAIAGLMLHNWRLPERKFTYLLAPAYGFKSKDLVGFGHLSYRFKPAEAISWAEIGVDAKQFAYRYNEMFDETLDYDKISPYVNLRFENPTNNFYSDLELRYSSINRSFISAIDSLRHSVDSRNNTYFEGSYTMEKRRAINPWSLRLSVETGKLDLFNNSENFVIPKAEFIYNYTYAAKKNINFRLFAATLFSDFKNRNIFGLLNLTGQGYTTNNDYQFEDWYFGRNEVEGLWSQQISMREGGFKNALPITQANNGFSSNSLLIALNLKADFPLEFPLNLPIKPYFDIAYVERQIDRDRSGTVDADEKMDFKDQIWWSGGFCLEFGDVFGVYFPVVSSDNIKQLNTDHRAKYFNRVSFMLNLQKLNPRKIADQVSF